MHWNIHKGREECAFTPPQTHADCVNSLDEITTYLVNNRADIVSLNEVENQRNPYTNPDLSCCEDQPARIEHDITVGLEAKTQQCWESLFIAPDGSAATGTTGELLLWRSSEKPCGQPGQGTVGFQKQAPPERHQLPFESPDGYRSAATVTLLIGPSSRPVTFFTTHLCPPPDGCTATQRQAQVDDLKLWAAGKAAPHVIAGDFNAPPGASEISGPTGMTAAYVDLWTEAVNGGKATPAGNLSEPTHVNGNHFDYIFRSPDATLSLVSMKIERQKNPQSQRDVSDHFPVVATLTIQ